MSKTRVIYIMGAGRSGSTILGIVLGNIDDCFFAGELHLYNKTKGVTFNDRPEVEKFWNKIRLEFEKNEHYFSYDFDKKLEYHTAAIHTFFRSKKSSIVKMFHQQSTRLFNLIHRYTGDKTVIDSSHYPLRAYWLAKNSELDVSYIYLYRNPVYVIQSFRKKNIEQPSKSFLSANLYLFLVSVLNNIIYLLLPHGKKMRLRYETLINSTDASLKRIEGIAKVKAPYPFNKIRLKTGLIFRSNRIRHSETLNLETAIQPINANFFLKGLIYLVHWPFILFHRKG